MYCGLIVFIFCYYLVLIVLDYGKYLWFIVVGVNILWEEGKGILFDDMFEYFVCNGVWEDCVVLIVDIFRFNFGFVDGLI